MPSTIAMLLIWEMCNRLHGGHGPESVQDLYDEMVAELGLSKPSEKKIRFHIKAEIDLIEGNGLCTAEQANIIRKTIAPGAVNES